MTFPAEQSYPAEQTQSYAFAQEEPGLCVCSREEGDSA
jgi:hypothetical protein